MKKICKKKKKKSSFTFLGEWRMFEKSCCVFQFDKGSTAAMQILVTSSQTQLCRFFRSVRAYKYVYYKA